MHYLVQVSIGSSVYWGVGCDGKACELGIWLMEDKALAQAECDRLNGVLNASSLA